MWCADATDCQVWRELSLLTREALSRKFVFDVCIEVFEGFGDNRKANPKHARALKGREAARAADLDFKWTESGCRELYTFADSLDSGLLDITKKLQGKMNIRRPGPTHMGFDFSQYCLKLADSFFDRFRDLDADERTNDVAQLILSFP